jgi:hypothetical protein
VPDCVHASVLRVESPGGHAIRHAAPPESETGKLRGRHQPVLPGGKTGQLRIEERGCVTFVLSWRTFVNHPPIVTIGAFQFSP